MSKKVSLGKINIKNDTDRLLLISGPCLLENERLIRNIATKLIKFSNENKYDLVFKCSFDKANRSSGKTIRNKISFEKSIDILKNLKEDLKIPITSDVHETKQIDKLESLLDIIQIPAFLCRQTDLIRAAAQTKKIVNVKKGQFLSHREVENIILKIENQNNNRILITERGNSFGYNYLINDFKGIHFMKQFGYPIVFDSTHSVQLPGGMGIKSGGAREYVVPLSKSAASLRLAGFFIETHPNPEKALSDGPNMMHLHNMPKLLNSINKINKAAK
ncbi:MAG: 3-deoxy-8-phosphooctulonate synthase [Pelagibacteraceae bacterium TMED259]|nr:MAG: 3-deoxy-8-phosphooctulonate synthase [Pelagibacteraceae bacterium TMED259]